MCALMLNYMLKISFFGMNTRMGIYGGLLEHFMCRLEWHVF